MRAYELVLIVDPDLNLESQKKVLAKIKKEIEEVKGKITKETEWGKKELSYSLAKKEQGIFFIWELSLTEQGPLQLDKKLKAEEEILRYLLVKAAKGGKHGAKIVK